MPITDIQGTIFTCEVLPPKTALDRAWVRLRITLKNDYVSYEEVQRIVLLEDIEEWIFAMHRLLAGAYAKEYSLSFEKAGLAVDLYPNGGCENGKPLSRRERREKDCMMAVRLLMRSQDKKSFLGGVYTLLFHREELSAFAAALRAEFYAAYPDYEQGKGKLTFVGVSPLGCAGCNYWYYEETGDVQAGDYVWVRMGKHHTEQIVCVDCARQFTEMNAPYDPERVKRVLRMATDEEVQAAHAESAHSARK